MAITSRPKQKIDEASQPGSAAVDAFISGAPDAPKPRGVKKGKRQQISLTITPALLEKIDQMANELGQSRAAVINMAIYRAVEHGLTIDGLHKA